MTLPGTPQWEARVEAVCREYEALFGCQPYAVLSHAKEAIAAVHWAAGETHEHGEAVLRVGMAIARAGEYQGAT